MLTLVSVFQQTSDTAIITDRLLFTLSARGKHIGCLKLSEQMTSGVIYLVSTVIIIMFSHWFLIDFSSVFFLCKNLTYYIKGETTILSLVSLLISTKDPREVCEGHPS